MAWSLRWMCGINTCIHSWYDAAGRRSTSRRTSSARFFIPVLFFCRFPSIRVWWGQESWRYNLYVYDISVCVRVCCCWDGQGRQRIQNRVHCEPNVVNSSARLQCLAQLPVAEPLINFTKGGLAEFSCALSTPGCLTTGFRLLGAWVCAARDKRGRE